MKIAVSSIAACAVFFALDATQPALAQYQYDQPPYAVVVVPPRAVMSIVRSQGFAPVSRPELRGAFYVVRAVEEDRMMVRVVVDGRTGRIVRVTETGEWHDARFGAFTPPPGEIPGGAPSASPAEMAERIPSAATSAERIPLPRPAPSPQTRLVAAPPPQTQPAAPPPVVLPPSMQAVIAGDKPPAKSAPAPVGGPEPATTGSVTPPAAPPQTTASANTPPAADTASPPARPSTRSVPGVELKPTEMIPVAPLE